MKKYCVIFFMLSSSIVVGQSVQGDMVKIDSTERNLFQKTKVKSVTTWTYSIQNGKINSEGEKSEVKKYDLSGKNIYDWEPAEFEYTFTYDAKGNRVESILKDSYYNTTIKETWKYDASNNCIQHCNGCNCNDYTYENTNCIQESEYGCGSQTKKYYFAYDPKGNKTEKYGMQNGSKSLIEKWNYDTNNKIIEYIKYWYDKVDMHITYKYDLNNRKIEENHLDNIGNISFRSKYAYDNKGNLADEWDDFFSGIVSKSHVKYIYDYKGKLIQANSYNDNNNFRSSDSIKYQYNNEGLLIEKKSGNTIKYVYEFYQLEELNSNLTEISLQNKFSVTDNISYLLNYKGKSPFEIKLLDDSIVKNRLIKMIGKEKYQYVKNIWQVATPIEVEEGIFYASGMKAHSGGAISALLMADIKQNLFYLAIRTDATIKTYAEDKSDISNKINNHGDIRNYKVVIQIDSTINIGGHSFDKCITCFSDPTDKWIGYYQSTDGSYIFIQKCKKVKWDDQQLYFIQCNYKPLDEYSYYGFIWKESLSMYDESDPMGSTNFFELKSQGIGHDNKIFVKK